MSLRVENGALTIQNGFTHYPQQREIIRYFCGDVALPERIILLDGSGSVSFDVLSWLAEQKVALIRINWKGDIVCVAGGSGYSAKGPLSYYLEGVAIRAKDSYSNVVPKAVAVLVDNQFDKDDVYTALGQRWNLANGQKMVETLKELEFDDLYKNAKQKGHTLKDR